MILHPENTKDFLYSTWSFSPLALGKVFCPLEHSFIGSDSQHMYKISGLLRKLDGQTDLTCVISEDTSLSHGCIQRL